VNAITNLAPRIARRVRSVRHGSEQTPAIAAPLSAPTFTPTLARTEPIRITGRHAQVRPVLPVRIPGPAPATPRLLPVDDEGLRRVRDAIRDIPVDAPDPNLSRAEKFTFDMRHTTGLPIFRLVARKRGWCGLNEERPPAAWSPLGAWRLAELEQDLLNAIAAGTKTARIEVGGTWEALARQTATERGWRGTRAATGLGYPDGAS
jgi:hypothetical protein